MFNFDSFIPSMICLDVDGVLADFIKGVAKLYGRSYEEVMAYGKWDIFNFFNVTEERFWADVDAAGTEFWPCFDGYPWTNQIYDLCKRWCPNVYLVTSPGKSVSAATGKLQWIQDRFPEIIQLGRYFVGEHKALLAGPDRLLIDDNDKNCKKFEQAGGKVLLFPQPWNSSTHKPEDVINYLASVTG